MKLMKKCLRLLVLAVVLCMAAQLLLPAGAAAAAKKTEAFGSDIILPPDEFGDDPMDQFSDVVKGKWYYNAVKYMVEKGYMSGTSSTTFAPGKTLTRAEFVQVLYKVFKGRPVSSSNPFTDVKSGKWYYDAVLWAYQNKITSGTSATTFSPNTDVTREQVAQFMKNAFPNAVGSGSGSVNSFSDGGSVSGWAVSAMNWAIRMGIISGAKNSDGSVTLSPKQTATRAELASIIYRILK